VLSDSHRDAKGDKTELLHIGVHPIQNPAAMAVVAHVETQADALRHQNVEAAADVVAERVVGAPTPVFRVGIVAEEVGVTRRNKGRHGSFWLAGKIVVHEVERAESRVLITVAGAEADGPDFALHAKPVEEHFASDAGVDAHALRPAADIPVPKAPKAVTRTTPSRILRRRGGGDAQQQEESNRPTYHV
jgi:hypothetical protein